jgi:hypothetical protein
MAKTGNLQPMPSMIVFFPFSKNWYTTNPSSSRWISDQIQNAYGAGVKYVSLPE